MYKYIYSLTDVVDISTEGWRIVNVFTASATLVIPAGADSCVNK